MLHLEMKYNAIPSSRTLDFWNLPLTRTKSHFPPLSPTLKLYPRFLKLPDFRFHWRLEKSGKEIENVYSLVTSLVTGLKHYDKCELTFSLADPPSYDGGAAISGYIMEMENPVTKGQNSTFVFYFAVGIKILI